MRQEKPAFGTRTKSRFSAKFADEAQFIKAWLDNPSITGALSPSGRQLARYMALQVDPASTGPVIELGPGTGPVTRALVHRGIDEARLVLVEYDADFCKLLAARYPRAKIVQGDAYDLARTLAGVLNGPAAAVVSSLPLLLRSEPERLALLSDAFGMLAPAAPFIQFTYGLKSPIARLAEAGGAPFHSRRSKPIWLNLPPAHVWVYGRSAEALSGPRLDFMDALDATTRRMRGKLRSVTLKMRAKIVRRMEKARKQMAS